MKRLFLTILWITPLVFGADQTDFLLGRELLLEKSFEMAAIEFRRFALESEKPEQQAQAYLHAAYSYIRAETIEDAEHMLHLVEKRTPNDPFLPLLYAELAARKNDTQTALYFLDLLSFSSETNRPLNLFGVRRSAEMLLRSGEIEKARQCLLYSPTHETHAITALEEYLATPKKRPPIGGLLGLIPGTGYWYSGEIANGFRSLLLNSLFMFGMYHTAQDEQWGAFAVISFFEITWYSGSIYGGIDAAHRYNRERLDHCIEHLNVPTIELDKDIDIPLFQLRVVF